jgi:hypothetical protein
MSCFIILLRNFNNQDYSSNDIYFVRLLFLDISIFLASICRFRRIEFEKVKNIINLISSYKLIVIKYLTLLKQHCNKFAKQYNKFLNYVYKNLIKKEEFFLLISL